MTRRPFSWLRLLWVVGALLMGDRQLEAATDAELIPFTNNGPTSERINLVVLAEGYLSTQRELFIRDARVVADGILSTSPFKGYAGHFNTYGVFVASQESGSDHPFRGVLRDTYFNSTYDSFGIQRLVTIPPNNLDPNSANGQGKVIQLLSEVLPEYDIVAIVVNDPEYGGSGGPSLVVSTHSQSREIAVHELGHTLAGLGDEYSSANPGYPDVEEPNTTRTQVRSQIKWNSWIKASTPVPTPENGFVSEVGLFEGAHYHATGWFRPKYECKMKVLGVPFCEVCSEALVLSIYQHLPQPISVSPASDAAVPVSIYDQRTFELNILPGASETIAVSWLLNGVPMGPPAKSTLLSVPGIGLPFETNELTALLTITSPWVRQDPLKHMQSSVQWQVVRDATSPPRIRVEFVADKLRFSWSAVATGFVFETSSSAALATWSSAGATPTKVGNEFRVQVSPTGSRAFYRLRR